MSSLFNPCSYTGPEQGFRAPPMPAPVCSWCDVELVGWEPGDRFMCPSCKEDEQAARNQADLDAAQEGLL